MPSSTAIELPAPPDVLPQWLDAMRCGEFERAWQQTDRIELPRRRADAEGRFVPQAHHLIWNGSGVAGRTVLIRCEHGLGDTIQFLRYVKRLSGLARRVIVKIQPALLDLCDGISGVDDLRNGWTDEPDPPHDVQVECMEFPYVFRDTTASIPGETPYLPVSNIWVRSSLRLLPDANMAVGLIWAASSWDDSRSLQPDELTPLDTVRGATFHSLQQGTQQTVDQLSFQVTDVSPLTTNVRDVAAAMLQLDLIITVDSMTAHLAGALGCPVWVMLKHDCDWRWMSDRIDTPWYPSMRLFRQHEPGDWSGVIREIASALRKEALLPLVNRQESRFRRRVPCPPTP